MVTTFSSPTPGPGVSQGSNHLCKALYTFQARQDDELNLEKGKTHSQIFCVFMLLRFL